MSRYDPSTSSGGASSTNLAGAEPAPGGPIGQNVPRASGKTVTTYTPKDGLADKSVFSILQDRDGMIWLGSPNGGVTRYDPSGGGFAILDTKGRVANTVSSILQDREGYFWFSTLGGGVSRYDPSWPTRGTSSGQDGIEWIKFTTKDGLADNYVYSIFQDRDSHIWFATNGGLSRYDGSTFSNFTVKDGLANNTVISILQDRDGYFWFSTYDGLSRYNGSTFSNFEVKDGLPNNYMASSYQDREGYIWFGTLTGAVSRYDGEAFTTFTTEDGLGDNAVMSISHDRKGHLWFGTADGLSLYDGRTFTTFTTRDGLAHNTVMSVFQDREGHLWFGTGGGLSRYDGDTFSTFTARDGLAHDVVISIFQDREGHLWFGTKDGVSRHEPSTRSGDIKGTFTTFTAQDGLGYDQVMSIFQDREGNLWFGTEGGGVSRYDGDVLTTFTTRDGLADVSIGRSSILQDREGYLWFGTQTGGMSRFDPSASSGHAFTTFTTRDGLANNQVTSAFKDRDGNLWFGTGGRGVSRYDGTAFTTFTTQDGLAASQVSSIFQDREGYLWFGTSSGVTRYRTQAPSPPPVSIHAVVADHRYVGESEISIPSSVKLAAFEFGGISFKTRPEAMFYRYRLKGYDQDWKSTHSRRVEYEDLPRGSYNFEVKAVDRDLVPSEAPATVALIVHLPYERILWLSALSIAVLLVALQAGRVIQRDRRLRETNLKLDESNRAMSSANKELFEINKALQLAKKQAERERAEDRVRAEIATMRESTDLQNITPLIWKELADLDVGFSRCGVFIIDEEKKQISLYLSTPQGKSLGAVDLDLDTDHPLLQSMVDHWRKKEVFVHPWDAQAFLDWMQFLQGQGQSIEPEEYMDGEAPPELLILHTVPFSHGMLYVGSPSPLPEEDLELVKGLADAFSVAYARYLDMTREKWTVV